MGIKTRLKALGGIIPWRSTTDVTTPLGQGAVVGISNDAPFYKAVIPQFLYKPPFGYPRFVDIPQMRRLAATPYVAMCVNTIIDEIAAIEWDVVPRESLDTPDGEETNNPVEHIQEVLKFLNNPNINKENFNILLRRIIRDILEIDAGVLIKVFNMKGDLKEIYARDGGCLSYYNLVETDEGFIPIGKIVNHKLTPKVKTYNFETKQIEWKKIIGHKKSGISNKWKRIKAKTNTKHRTIEAITHMIPTPNGHVNSDDLRVGDMIYTQQNKLNKTQEQIILGSLLGDGSLRKGESEHAKIYFKETHSEKQKEYIKWKLENFKELNPVYREYMSRFSKDYEPTLKCEFKTRADIVFEEFYDLKYPKFTKEIFDRLEALGFAVWLQDDGYMYPYGAIEIASHCMPKEIQEYALQKLKEKWDIQGKLAFDKRCEKWFMRFSKENSKKILEIIKEYIHPNMEYKFKTCGNPPIDSKTTLNLLETEIYQIEEIYKKDMKFDIEVENNHNFFCNGLLVHNTFTMNPDHYGTFQNCIDLITPQIMMSISHEDRESFMKNKPAYFQYGWMTGARPMPFGTREVIYFMKNPRTETIYGQSAVEVLMDTIQLLVYGQDMNLDYFTDNNIPKGYFKLKGATSEQAKAFKEEWNSATKVKNEVGDWRKRWWNIPVINSDGAFERIQMSPQELELITQQQWFTKLVWSNFGVTPSELGYTESSNKATELVQSRVFRRKAIRPILQLIEHHINNELIWSEFHEDVEFKFMTDDVGMAKEQADLDKIYLDKGVKSINEVREEMQLPPVEDGDDHKGTGGFNPFDNQSNDGENFKPNDEQGDQEHKPSKEEEEKFPKKKANDIESLITSKLKESESLILQLLKQTLPGKTKIAQIKALDTSIIKKIISLLSLDILSEPIRSEVRVNYLKGHESGEKSVNMNVPYNKNAVSFLEDYTFDNVKDISNEIKNDLRQELQRGIMSGEPYSKMAERVKNVFDVQGNRAKMIAVTETNRAENTGMLHAIKTSGVKGKKEWVAVLDNKTCPICKALDGTQVDINENFEYKTLSTPIPLAHVNCRCKLVFIPEI